MLVAQSVSADGCGTKCAENLRILLRSSSEHEFKPGVAVFNMLPDTPDTYKTVFGDPPSKRQEDAISSFAKATAKSQRVNPEGKSIDSIEGLTDALRQSPTKLVIVIGHNEDGVFQFPSGFHLALNEFSQSCTDSKVVCVFLSCSAASKYQEILGVLNPITVGEARNIYTRMAVKFSVVAPDEIVHAAVSGALQSEVTKLEGSEARKLYVANISAVSGVAGALMLVAQFWSPSDGQSQPGK